MASNCLSLGNTKRARQFNIHGPSKSVRNMLHMETLGQEMEGTGAARR